VVVKENIDCGAGSRDPSRLEAAKESRRRLSRGLAFGERGSRRDRGLEKIAPIDRPCSGQA
jgi:hypothetical protein